MRRSGVGAYLDLSRQRNLREYSKDAMQFESLLAKAQQDPTLTNAWWLPLARQKAEHMQRVVGSWRPAGCVARLLYCGIGGPTAVFPPRACPRCCEICSSKLPL